VPFIVAGDFNQTRGASLAYRSVKGAELLDEQLKRNNLECLTEEDFGAEGKLSPDPRKSYCRQNIDHICVTKGTFRVEKVGAWDHFTAKRELSDHNGVFVDLAPSSKGG
jgi:endonuclease/exonuclease/phosphatase family metal-dependent hydrolase